MAPSPEQCHALAERFERGESVSAACARVGLSRSSYYRSLRVGHRALREAGVPHPAPDDVAPAVREDAAFALMMDDARGRAIERRQKLLTDATTDGVRSEKVVTKVGVWYDVDGNPHEVNETVTTVEYKVNPQLALKELARLDPSGYGGGGVDIGDLDEATIAELLRDAARYEVFVGEGNEINRAIWSGMRERIEATPVPTSKLDQMAAMDRAFMESYAEVFGEPVALDYGPGGPTPAELDAIPGPDHIPEPTMASPETHPELYAIGAPEYTGPVPDGWEPDEDEPG